MRLIVAGGRRYDLTELDVGTLARIVEQLGVDEIVTGGCRGALKA